MKPTIPHAVIKPGLPRVDEHGPLHRTFIELRCPTLKDMAQILGPLGQQPSLRRVA